MRELISIKKKIYIYIYIKRRRGMVEHSLRILASGEKDTTIKQPKVNYLFG